MRGSNCGIMYTGMHIKTLTVYTRSEAVMGCKKTIGASPCTNIVQVGGGEWEWVAYMVWDLQCLQ